jgi:hypothetical protein
VHLAKATVIAKGKEGWYRELEIDGHDVSHHDPDWPAGVRGPDFGYLTRFAVFEFPRNSAEIARRAELERTILHFAENYARYQSIDRMTDDMVDQGFDPELVHEVESISTIAFGRTLFEPLGVHFPPTILRACRDGRVEAGVPLMGIPAYSRGRAIAVRLRGTMSKEDFQALCLYNAESQAIVNAKDASGDKFDFTRLTMYPSVVPDRGASQQTMDAAMATLRAMVEQGRAARTKKKPWWKFW